MKHTVYIIKNTKNQKVYIGQTCQTLHERFLQHKKPSAHKRGKYKIYNAMKKYGIENFYIEELESNISSENIDEREIYYINLFNSFENGYNSTRGADAKFISINDENFKEMFNKGLAYKEIANHYDVSIATVVRTAKRYNMQRKNKVTKEYLLNNLHKTNKQMSEELNVDVYTITRNLKKHGLKRGTGYWNNTLPQNQAVVTKELLEKYSGLSNTEISKILNVSVSTVSRSWKKIGVKNESVSTIPLGSKVDLITT